MQAKWKKHGGESIEITTSVSGCTLESVLKCAMSYEGNNIQDDIERYTHLIAF